MHDCLRQVHVTMSCMCKWILWVHAHLYRYGKSFIPVNITAFEMVSNVRTEYVCNGDYMCRTVYVCNGDYMCRTVYVCNGDYMCRTVCV